MNLTLSELYNAMYTGNENAGDLSFYGIVRSKITENGVVVAYTVEVGDSVIEARKLAGANVGDIVLCTTLSNGITAVTGALNGDKDAAEAIATANDVQARADRGDFDGEDGADGSDGVSVTGLQNQFYLSTSSSTPTGGSWGNTMTYQTGKYIWTRDVITFSDGNTGYTPAVYNQALTESCLNALNAKTIADNTNQYFWFTSTGTDTGAHITRVPQADFISSPATAGGNLLARSNGLAVRNGLTELATFGATSAQVGQSASGHTLIQTTGLDVYGGNGTVNLAHIGYASGTAQSGTATAPYYTFGERKSGTAVGNYSMAEGIMADASGYASHSEGSWTKATNHYAHAEGSSTTASGQGSHAEGANTTSSGYYTHAEGYQTTAGDYYSHAEGYETTANGEAAHAEGWLSSATGDFAHAGGSGTKASSYSQTAIGKWNVNDSNDNYALIVGNGNNDSSRSNAMAVGWNGNLRVAGNVYAGCSANSSGGDILAKRDELGVYGTETFDSESLSSGTTWTKIGTLTLNKGRYVLVASCEYTGNTGRRGLRWSSQDHSENTTMANSAGSTKMQSIAIVAPSSDGTTYTLQGFQNNGSAQTPTASVRWIRIAPR